MRVLYVVGCHRIMTRIWCRTIFLMRNYTRTIIGDRACWATLNTLWTLIWWLVYLIWCTEIYRSFDTWTDFGLVWLDSNKCLFIWAEWEDTWTDWLLFIKEWFFFTLLHLRCTATIRIGALFFNNKNGSFSRVDLISQKLAFHILSTWLCDSASTLNKTHLYSFDLWVKAILILF